jgi:hypothetical protein
MWNFALGAVAGAVTAGVLTIAAARQPEFQSRMGLVAAKSSITSAMAKSGEAQCPPPKSQPKPVGTAQDILFNRQRFWSVTP